MWTLANKHFFLLNLLNFVHSQTLLFKTNQAHNCDIYRVSQKECARLRENVPYVKVHRYNPKTPISKVERTGDNGERSLKV